MGRDGPDEARSSVSLFGTMESRCFFLKNVLLNVQLRRRVQNSFEVPRWFICLKVSFLGKS